MASGHRISWVRLILGGSVAFSLAATLLILIGPLVAIRFYGGDNYQIKSESMAPALLTGDWVLARPMDYGAVPARGTIVAYEHPRLRDVFAVMRVIGLPGERIQLRGGAVYINGQRANMERLADRAIRKRPPGRHTRMPRCVNNPVEVNGECLQELWRETLSDGTATLIISTQGTVGMAKLSSRPSADDTPAFVIPADAVFVMGDNRDRSLDSRYPDHGMVPIKNLRHKVWMIHTSLDKSSRFISPRWDRFFREVH